MRPWRHLISLQTTGQKVAADAAVALFVAIVVGLVLASFSAAGIITMTLAIILLVLAWFVAMIGTFLMPHLWNPSPKHRALFGFALAVFLFVIGTLEFRYHPAEAQPVPPTPAQPIAPSYSQACQPGAGCSQGQTGGQTIGTLNQYGPVHRPNGMYQNGQSIGLVESSELDEKRGIMKLKNPRISGGAIDFDSSFEFRDSKSRDYMLNCPQLKPQRGKNAANVSIMLVGVTECSVVQN